MQEIIADCMMKVAIPKVWKLRNRIMYRVKLHKFEHIALLGYFDIKLVYPCKIAPLNFNGMLVYLVNWKY